MCASAYLRAFLGRSTRIAWRPPTIVSRPCLIQTRLFRSFPSLRQDNAQSNVSQENLYSGHSRFIAEAPRHEKWSDGVGNAHRGGEEGTGEEVENIPEGKGRLSPTSSHLFKLIIPIPTDEAKPYPLTVFLLHPSQPLSHVSRLILASLPPDTPATTNITFRSAPQKPTSKQVQWSDSTDIGDFVKEAVQDREFTVTIASKKPKSESSAATSPEHHIHILVPSFRSRTRFLRQRLRTISEELSKLEKVKRDCDHIAHRSARRLALGGFGLLLVYFGGVARLTFWDLGWEVMEPVTYLSGLTWIIAGYMWFLYQGREVSYSSLLKQSVSTRRAKLYESKGLDVDLWADLVSEEKQIKREINKIADDYNLKWDGTPDGNFTVVNSTTGAKSDNGSAGLSKKTSKDGGKEGRELTPEEAQEKLKRVEEKSKIKRDQSDEKDKTDKD